MAMIPSYNDHDPTEIAPGVYHLGVADPVHSWANIPYLVVQDGRAVLIDPGSAKPEFFQCVLRKVKAVIDPRIIDVMVVQHQDPDLCAALPLFEPLVHPEAKIVCALESAMLVQHYGLSRPLVTVEDGEALAVAGSRTLRFFMTPYAHFVGSMMTYDDATKTLFSSDAFGGFSEGSGVYADTRYVELVGTFLGQYLGSKRALEYLLLRIADLRRGPGIDRLCPQHGCVIDGVDIPAYLEFANGLEVGGEIDRLAARNRIRMTWREVQETTKMGEFSGDEALVLIERIVRGTTGSRRAELEQALGAAGFIIDGEGRPNNLPSDLPQSMLKLYESVAAFPTARVTLKRFFSERGVAF